MGKPPMFPVWLSPTQVRIIPMSNSYLDYSEKMAEIIEKNQIRVDIDDRPLTLPKRIREAEMEWIPYIIVIGQKEMESEVLPVRYRKAREIQKMKLEELINKIKKETDGKPFLPLPLPRYVSKRPQFSG
jgi:threonyl-tRNA synthetase